MTRMKTTLAVMIMAFATTGAALETAYAATATGAPGGGQNTAGTPTHDTGNRDPRRPKICLTGNDCSNDEAKVCFFSLPDFKGKSFCTEPSKNLSSLGRNWNDQISSIAVYNAKAKVCSDQSLEGKCIFINSSRSHLNSLDDEISSIMIR